VLGRLKPNVEWFMNLAIVDSNILDLIQKEGILHYLIKLPFLDLVPSRRAREEAEVSGREYTTPFERSFDAPVPAITNDLNRRTNDAAVIVGPSPGMKHVAQMKLSVYSKAKTRNHADDQEVIGSALDLYEIRKRDERYKRFYFISGDRHCCKKANDYFRLQRIPIEVLYARLPGAKSVSGVREVSQVLVSSK
jgi:hypothetical protein